MSERIRIIAKESPHTNFVRNALNFGSATRDVRAGECIYADDVRAEPKSCRGRVIDPLALPESSA